MISFTREEKRMEHRKGKRRIVRRDNEIFYMETTATYFWLIYPCILSHLIIAWDAAHHHIGMTSDEFCHATHGNMGEGRNGKKW